VRKLGEIISVKSLAAGLLSVAVLLLTFGAATSTGRDLAGDLANAEANVARYEAELPEQRQQVSAAEARYRAAARHAVPAQRTLRQARAAARSVRRELAVEERKAKAQIVKARHQRQEEVDDHDEQVRSGIGFGLAALVAALIAVAWGFFRASDPVAALARIDLARAVGLCVGVGLVVLIVGAALSSADGAIAALGYFIFCLGLILPTAFLLARHSAEVQRGRAKPLLRRERLPNWVPLATAGLMLVLFLAGTGSAVFGPGASPEPISAQLEKEAEGPAGGHGAEELEAAQEKLATAKQQAAAPLARRIRAQRQLASVRRELHRVQSRLAAARSSERSFSQRLVALEEKEQREAEKEEAQALREQEAQEEVEAEEAEEYEEELASECDPNYGGCLDPYSPDYDCASGSGDGPDYTGTVEVLGVDHYGLDDDGDGTGCDLG
jgi:hypothetical protein